MSAYKKKFAGGLNFWLHLGCPDEDITIYQDQDTKQVVRDIPERFKNIDTLSDKDLQDFVDTNKDQVLNYELKRDGDIIDKQITAVVREETGRGGIGVGVADTGLVRYPAHLAVWHGLESVYFLTLAILAAFWELISGLFMGKGMSAELAGPVGIAALTGQVAHMGFVYLLQFTVMLSVNLAIINALPFPALDGGRIFFLIIEKLKGSPVKREIEAVVHNTGFALLMVMVLLVTFKDVSRYSGVFKSLWGKIVGLF